MDRLRTLIFMAIFYSGSVVLVLCAVFAIPFGETGMVRYAQGWAHFHRWATRNLLGIRTRIEGQLPDGVVLYAVKHQAMYETVELALVLDAPAVVLKRELADIPVWGWAAKRSGAIVADREASAGALRSMIRGARAAQARGRSILIYPEGTRVAPGEQPPLQSGFAGLYRMLDLPVVPIAVDSGKVWPRKGPKRAGTITFRIGEAIPPGIPRAEIEARVHAAINALDTPTA